MTACATDEGVQLQLRGDWVTAIEVLPAAIAAAREQGDEAAAIEGALALAAAQHLLGSDSEAHDTYADAIARSAALPALNARAYFEMGKMYADPALLDWAITVWDGIFDEESVAWAGRARAAASAMRDDLESASSWYVLATHALERVLGTSHPRLVAVFDELAAFHDRRADADAAHAARTRAFEVALAFAGPSARVTINAGLAAEGPAGALRGKEASLVYREAALGILDPSLVPSRTEIKDGWIALGKAGEAEAFLVRCRSRTTADTSLYRDLTRELGSLLADQERRDDCAALWRDFVAARDAICAPGSAEVIDALETAIRCARYVVPAYERVVLSERLISLAETRGGLHELAQAYRAADRRDKARETWTRLIDRWIDALRAGTVDDEPAIRLLAADFDATGTFPAHGPPSEAQLAAIAVYDDAIARATAIAGDDRPELAKIFLERGAMLASFSMRTDEAAADLARARTLLERVEGPHGDTVCFALTQLAEHCDRFGTRDAAIAALRDTIAARAVEEPHERHRLADWLEGRAGEGDLAEAIAIREQLVTSGKPDRVSNELDELVRIHVERGDLAAATATCARFATEANQAPGYARFYAVEAWWRLLNAKCAAGDVGGARAAVDAIVELWRYPEVSPRIQQRANDARELPVAAYFRAQVEALAFAGLDDSRALEARLAPTLSDDVAPVLADALIGIGDPRGELIIVQQRLASAPADAELVARQGQLLALHRVRLLGVLEESYVTWHLGYWKAIELPPYPMWLVSELRAIVEHPSARYLESLTFKDPFSSVDPALCAAAPWLARIPTLRVTPRPDDDDRVAVLQAAIPSLEFSTPEVEQEDSGWPDDPGEATALLRARATSTPIDDSAPSYQITEPWSFLDDLSTDVQWRSVRPVVLRLLDDPDPLVARRAIVFFGEDTRDDAVFDRLVEIGERIAPGPTATELQRVLSRWARDEAEARRVSAIIRRSTGDGVPASTKQVAVYEPEWVLDVVRRRADGADGRFGWECVRAAGLIAAFHPDLLLSLLTALRPVEVTLKQSALDAAGESLAVGSIAKPTLAECRAAIDEADEAPRGRTLLAKDPARFDGDAVLVAVAREALGRADDPSDCSVNLERTHEFRPPDVNDRGVDSATLGVRATRRDGPTLTIHTDVGEPRMSFEVGGAPAERDRILYLVWRTFGRPRDHVDA